MFNKSFFDDLKDKAQKTFEEIKSEAKKIQNNLEDKIESEISSKNNLTEKNIDFISSSVINKAAQYLLEKGIKHSEQFLDKYIKPYDVYEILEPSSIRRIIEEISSKVKEGQNNDHYYVDLIILYFNLNEYEKAASFISKLIDQSEKQKYELVYNLFQMNDNLFYDEFEKNISILLNLKIYSLIRRYSKICLNKHDYSRASKALEICCILNPLSENDHNDLMICYSKLMNESFYNLHKEIIKILK